MPLHRVGTRRREGVRKLLGGERIEVVAAIDDIHGAGGPVAPSEAHRQRAGQDGLIDEGNDNLERRLSLERKVRRRRRDGEEVRDIVVGVGRAGGVG